MILPRSLFMNIVDSVRGIFRWYVDDILSSSVKYAFTVASVVAFALYMYNVQEATKLRPSSEEIWKPSESQWMGWLPFVETNSIQRG